MIRLDGPDGPGSPPPTWATVDLLSDAIRAAATHSYTSVSVPAAADQPARTFRWGRQLDVRPVKALGDGSDITEQAVASYVAKYATKAAENTGTLDRRIGELSELDRHGVPNHTRRVIEACKLLDPLYPDRRLWAWAHMLGFRGHFSSKSRRYSSTLGALRQARADYTSDANIYVVVNGPEFDNESRGQGWTLSPWDKNMAFTRIPLKKERAYDSIEVSAYFSTCDCFECKAPYLHATSAVYTSSLAAVMASQDNMKRIACNLGCDRRGAILAGPVD